MKALIKLGSKVEVQLVFYRYQNKIQMVVKLFIFKYLPNW